ncbi:MAG: tRNA (adenosine(37)-N6)-threonylcarbamoyltransferase complex dimerization subunit type 1 TsaB [Clostridiales bacterium]|nr:tRNA (adenosine(37)-N6)-threonylcarbamoyltransferase complex dimerization subunit type 1 TsaB [Clostridiales bacterium]
MRILALDAAVNTASVAVLAAGKICAEVTLNTGLTHSEQLMPMVDRALTLSGIDIAEIEGLAATCGPGSFTGLRIGLATAKGLAQGLQVPIVVKTTLDVLAAGQVPHMGIICPILNARRKEVYTCVYKADGDRIYRQSQPQAVALSELLAGLSEAPNVLFCGDGVDVYTEAITAQWTGKPLFAQGLNRYVRAGVLAELAEADLKVGKGKSYLTVEPYYLRQSEAVLNWEKSHPGECLYD